MQILPNAQHISEFAAGYTGTCGETALAVALAAAKGFPKDQAGTTQLMLDLTHDMAAHGLLLNANGESTVTQLAAEATRQGVPIALQWDYAEPFPHDWHQVLLDNAGLKPIVIEVAQAHNLVGQLGTGNDEAGVHYHYVCVVGKQAEGYIVADGDNWDVKNTFAIYSYATLQAAVPCGLLMLDILPTPTTGGNMDPKYFSDAGNGVYKCIQTGKLLGHGILAFYEANSGLTRLGLPKSDEMSVSGKAGVVVQVFERGVVAYDPQRILDNPPGSSGDCYYAHLTLPEVQQALGLGGVPQAEVDSLQAQVQQLQAQLQTAQKQVGQLTPDQRTALTSALQVLQPSAQAVDDIKKVLS